jgi:hypothetical protein
MLSSLYIHLQPVKAHSILRKSGFPDWTYQVANTGIASRFGCDSAALFPSLSIMAPIKVEIPEA